MILSGISSFNISLIQILLGEAGCHLDRHENIGKGKIGLEGFRRVMNEPRFANLPMILETPYTNDDGYAKEIMLLESLVKK